VPDPEKELLDILRRCGVDFLCTLPCDRVRDLIALSDRDFFRLPLTREEEGVGICAGASLAGRKPAMIVQSSGLGNMLNALLSLTLFYGLPLALFVSHRGVYREGIPAQVPMGWSLPAILEASGIGHTIINERGKFSLVEEGLNAVYKEGRAHAFLLSPALWEGSGVKVTHKEGQCICESASPPPGGGACPAPEMTRYEVLEALRPFISGEVVVCNLGMPSKELYDVIPQPSNFYMLGSMGMATPIGLGIALSCEKKVFVIDGDGSILMNPGTLATAAQAAPGNLTILAIDNASYGSTGDQPSATGTCVDLEGVARGFGIKNTFKVSGRDQLADALKRCGEGLSFIHILALSGSRAVPNIPIDRLEIKRLFQDSLRS
jgi:sulfopyruvate decarboxylase subunit beta